MTVRTHSVITVDDAAVLRHLSAETAVHAMRCELTGHGRHETVSPPRSVIRLGQATVVITAGTTTRRTLGLRAYETSTDRDQATVVWNSDGQVRVVVVGTELGAARTGAIGGVAIDVLARRDAAVLGVIGSGPQAWRQVWAASAVRKLSAVRVFSPDSRHREALSHRIRTELGLTCVAVDSARRAVSAADMVILATSATQPVIDARWIRPGTHMTTLGPKTIADHELPLSVADRAEIIVTDSVEQAKAYPGRYMLDPARLTGLGAVLADRAAGRSSPAGITLFCSVGLAGTEIALADVIADSVADASGISMAKH